MGTNITYDVLTINKKKTLLFFRNFFTKRTKELKPAVQSAPGWKLFGKVPPRENLPKDSKIIQQVSKRHISLDIKLVGINTSTAVISTSLLYGQGVLWEEDSCKAVCKGSSY